MIVPNTQKIENDKRAILQVKVYISILNFCNFIVIEKFFKFQKYKKIEFQKSKDREEEIRTGRANCKWPDRVPVPCI